MSAEKDDYVESLILEGALEFAGIDLETGEMLYNFTDRLMEVDPKLYKSVLDSFYQEIIRLWELGFVNMNITERNPNITLSEKSFDPIQIASLDKLTQKTLIELIEMLGRR